MGWVEAAAEVLDNPGVFAFANLEGVFTSDLDFFWELSVGCIVPEKMNVCLHVAEIMDGNNLNFVWIEKAAGAENKASNTTETINGNFHHFAK